MTYSSDKSDASHSPAPDSQRSADQSGGEGVLYVVSTPIGNLDDITIRGINQLKNVDAIACEDKRRSVALLRHLGIEKPLLSYHEHSGDYEVAQILSRLQQGQSLALISDAGTPLIADPGYKLLQVLLEHGVRVVPVPGVSASISALSVSGLPTDRFRFEGFLPAKSEARRKRLAALSTETNTLIFYESPHRIQECLTDFCEIIGGERRACLAREMTKFYETFLRGTLSELEQRVSEDGDQRKGEFVLLVEGLPVSESNEQAMEEARAMLSVMLEELPVKQASALVAKMTGAKKNAVYQLALSLRDA